MLDLKIKTMDGQTHTFSVPDNTTIGNLKERTAATLSIPAGSQRVIYQGRVLANDYKLSQSHHEQTLHVVRSPAASSNNVPASQSGNRTSNQSTNATASNRPINAGGMMRINIGHANDINSIFQDAIGRSISGSLGSVLNQGSNVPGRPTIVDINLDDIQVEMERTPTVSGSVERSQQRPATTTTSHFYPRSMNSLWTHLGDLERLLESEQVSARSQPESTGGAGGENVNSNTIPADDVPAVQVEETESNSSVEFSQTPVPLRPSQRSLNLSNTNLGPSDQNQSTSQTNTNNTTRDRNRTVMVSEFHDFMRRFTLLQPRISRWMTRATDFYARDPSFQSTTGEDYVEQEIFLQNFQQANRLIGMIHRSLANAHVPLSQIPPRALMAQTRQEAVPLVSGMSIFRTEREIPAGGAPEAARSSRRSETSNASGRRDRGRIHVRSSTPSSRSASANFNMPSNSFTLNAQINPRIVVTRTNVPSGNLPIGVRVVTNRVPNNMMPNNMMPPHSNQPASTGNNQQQNQNRARANVSVNNVPIPTAGSVNAPRTTGGPVQSLHNAVNNALNANNGIGSEISRFLNTALSSNISNAVAQVLATNPVNPSQQPRQGPNMPTPNVAPRQPRPSVPTTQRQNVQSAQSQNVRQNVQAEQPRPQRGGPQIEDSDVDDFNGLSAETVAELTSTNKISPPLRCLKDPAVVEARGTNGERTLGEIMMILYEKAVSRGLFTDNNLKLKDFFIHYDFPNFPLSHDNSDWNVMEKAMILLINTMHLSHVGALLGEEKFAIPQDWIIKFRHFFSTTLFDGSYIANKPRMIQKLRKHYPKIRDWLRMFFVSATSSPPHIDLVESNFNIITNFLEELFTLLFCGDTGKPCELGINYLVPRFFQAFLSLNMRHVDGGSESFVQYIHEYLTNKHGVRGGPIFELGLNHLLTNITNYSQQNEYADKFVHKRGHQPQYTKKPEKIGSTPGTSNSPCQSAQKRKSDSPDTDKPSTSKCKGHSLPNEINVDDWRKLVPREWVANIERDIARQRKMPINKKYSQAYKLGMSDNL